MINKDPNIFEIINSLSAFVAALFAILSFVLSYRIQMKPGDYNQFHLMPLLKSAFISIVVMFLMVFIFKTVQQWDVSEKQDKPIQKSEITKPVTIDIDSKFKYKFTASPFDSTIEIELRQIYKLGE